MTFDKLQEEAQDIIARAIARDTGKPFNITKVQQELADLLPKLELEEAGPKFLVEYQKFQANLLKGSTINPDLVKQYADKFYYSDQTLTAYAHKQWSDLAGRINSILSDDPEAGMRAIQKLFNDQPKVQVIYKRKDGTTKVSNWTIDNYRRRRNRDIAREGTQAVANDAARQLGTSYFISSYHAGARPGCYPYQNIMFDEKNQADKVINGQYVWNASSTSIGEPDGLYGENCGHTKFAGLPGITKPEEVEMLPEEANYQVYRDNQTYGALAREQRANKTKLGIAQELYGADSPQAQLYQRTVNNQDDRLTAFADKKGITQDPARERPYGDISVE